MGIILKQTENRSELQKRIAKQLEDKAKNKDPNPADVPDGVEDSAYIKNTTTTSKYAWIWIVLILAVAGTIIWFAANPSNQ